MPGVDKENPHSPKHKSRSSEHNRHKRTDDKGEDKGHRKHRKHRHKDSSLRRSESEPRKSSSRHNSEEIDDERSNSVSKHKNHEKEEKDDGEALRHSGRSNKRYSEPILVINSMDNDTTDTAKRSSRSRERRSEPISSNHSTDKESKSEHRETLEPGDTTHTIRRSGRSRERRSETSNKHHSSSKESKSKHREKREIGDDGSVRSSGRSRERRSVTNENGVEERKSKHRNKGDRESRKHRKRTERSPERRSDTPNTSAEINANGVEETGSDEHHVKPRERHKKRDKSKDKDESKTVMAREKREKGESRRHKEENGRTRRERSPKSSDDAKLNPTVIKTLLLDGPSDVSIKGEEGKVSQRNLDNINASSDEYIWETPDGKHCVYLRTKEGDVAKEDTSVSEELEENGISSDIINLLKQEEEFWLKQHELKYPAAKRNSSIQNPTHDAEKSVIDMYRNKRNQSSKTEIELEEERLERETKRLERLRIHQEELIKKFQQNLLREERLKVTDEKPPYSSHNSHHTSRINDNPPYTSHKPHPLSRVSFPPVSGDPPYVNLPNDTRSAHIQSHAPPAYSDESHNKPIYSDKSRDIVLNETLENGLTKHNPNKTHDKTFYSANRHDRNSHNDRLHEVNQMNNVVYVGDRKPSNCDRKPPRTEKLCNGNLSPPTTRTVCFSDDEEIFRDTQRKMDRRKTKTDFRGYFSDPDILRDDSMQRTYLARSMIRQKKTSLRCTACCRPINDERLMHVEGRNFYWHLKCFFCIICQVFLNDKRTIRVRVTNFNLHCRYCYSAKTGEQLSEV